MKKLFLIGVNLLISFFITAQTPLIIDSCYSRARAQYPMLREKGLIDKTKDISLSNASKGYYPQFVIAGQATYQDPVTSIPPLGPNIKIPSFNKDQYKISGEIDQVIYDGGAIKYNKQSFEETSVINQQNLEVQLYALKDRINQLFFGILLIDKQIGQNDLVQKDIQNSLDKMLEGVKNGTAMGSAVSELHAELAQQQQNKIQLQASRNGYLDMLGAFINQPLNENTTLQTPENIVSSKDIKRPELKLYDAQKHSYDIQDKMLKVGNRPKLLFFFQGGYGRPGLNAFDNNFESYYIGGVRLNWQFGGLYTLKGQRELIDIYRQTSDIQKETFLFNTNISLKQQNDEIEKYRAMIEKDNEIISNRTEVKNASKAMMENGTITIHEYINQLDAEDQAKQNLLLHKVQLLLAEYTEQNTTGN